MSNTSDRIRAEAAEAALSRAKAELSWAEARRLAAERDAEALQLELDLSRASLAYTFAAWLERRGTIVLKALRLRRASNKIRSLQWARLVHASPFFNDDWYRTQYLQQDGAIGDLAHHYIVEGASRGFDPGPLFSTQFYLDANPDVARSGINPLIHYLLFGRLEHRETARSILASPDGAPNSNIDNRREEAALSSVLSIRVETTKAFEWNSLPDSADDGVTPPIELDGVLIARSIRRSEEGLQYASVSDALEIFAALSGRSTPDSRVSTRDVVAIEHAVLDADFGPKNFTFQDIWLPTARSLRVRCSLLESGLVVRAFQYEPGSLAPKLTAEVGIAPGPVKFVDIPISSALTPIVLTVSDAQGDLLDLAILPFPSLCRGGAHTKELLTYSQQDAYLGRLAGYSRKRLTAWVSARAQNSFAINSIEVDTTAANGGESVFDRDFLDWLKLTMHLRVGALTTSDEMPVRAQSYLRSALTDDFSDAPQRQGSARLEIAADCIPSIAALTCDEKEWATISETSAGAYLARIDTRRDHWVGVRPPHGLASLQSLQPRAASLSHPIIVRDAGSKTPQNIPSGGTGHIVWALMRRSDAQLNDANLMFPLAPDLSGPVLAAPASVRGITRSVAILPSHAGASVRLRSLASQADQNELSVVVLDDGTPAEVEASRILETRFAGRHSVLRVSNSHWNIEDALAESDCVSAILIAGHMRLHDARTLQTLAQIASWDRAATSGCSIILENPSRKRARIELFSNGLLPVTMPDGLTLLRERECRLAVGYSTFAVAMNAPSLFCFERTKWEHMKCRGSLDTEGKVVPDELIERAIELDLVHLTTSGISASLAMPMPASTYVIPPSIDLAQLHGTATFIEEFA